MNQLLSKVMSDLSTIIKEIQSFINGLEANNTGGISATEISNAIETYIVRPLGLSQLALKALMSQSQLETGNFKSPVFLATKSLFNRHKGFGDGFWTGQTYYASGADSNLRIYTSVEQSAQDFAELLKNPLYTHALFFLRAGEINHYFEELQSVGFSASPTYAANLSEIYNA